MPPKRKKLNGFCMYMMDNKRAFEIETNRSNLSMSDLVPLAHPGWKALTDAERLVYTSRSKDYSNDMGKMDCTRQYISDRVDIRAVNEARRSTEQRQLTDKWPSGHAVCMEKFYIIAFENMCDLPLETAVLPSEISCISYSLYAGISDIYHRFIDTGPPPLGFRYLCQTRSDNFHKIPVEKFDRATNNYRELWTDLLNFLNPDGSRVFPPVFCQFRRRNQVEASLQWLSDRAGMPNRLAKVYEMEVLLSELFVHNGVSPPSYAACSDLLTTSAFDYEADTRCEYHEEKEVPMDFCALGKAKKNCFCLSDSLASTYNIELTSNHLPERREIVSPLVISASSYGIKFHNVAPARPSQPTAAESGKGRGMSLEPRHCRYEPCDATPPVKKIEVKPEINETKEEPVRRPTSMSVSGMLAAKQVQPMRDREIGTKMAMLQLNTGTSSSSSSKFALPEAAPPPSCLPMPGGAWQGDDGLDADGVSTVRSKSRPNPTMGVGLGRGLGRGLTRH